MARLEDAVRAYEPDVAWIVALWLAIHEDEPAGDGRAGVQVDDTTAMLALALSRRMAEQHGLGPVSFDRLQERLQRAGVVMRPAGDADADAPTPPDDDGVAAASQGRGRAIWKCVYTENGWHCFIVGYEH
jgi:hypothetical protein